MKLSKWVADCGGTAIVAKKLGINQHRLRNYMRGSHIPRKKIFLKILLLSEGKVNAMDLIETRKG